MTVKEIAEKLGLAPVSVTDDTREVQGGYAGDLLSWVMGRVPEGAAWVTIMTNVNVVAVAVLRDVAMVIVAEGSESRVSPSILLLPMCIRSAPRCRGCSNER